MKNETINLKVFCGGKLNVIESESEFIVLYENRLVTQYDLLAIAASCEDKAEAWEVMNAASIVFHPLDDATFNELYGCVAMEIARTHKTDEFYYQDLFRKRYQNIRPGEVVNNKNNGKDIPDAWVVRDGHLIPVEVKLGKFDAKALKQLRRYMSAYASDSGIAVGRQLAVKLPHSIEFISLEELEGA